MQRTRLAALLALATACCVCSKAAPQPGEAPLTTPEASSAFEADVAEYLRRFPYQVTHDYTMRFTGGDAAKLNTWVAGARPALVRAGEDVVPRTNNDTFYKGAAVFLEHGPVVLEAAAPSADRFNSFQLVDDRNVNYRNIVYPSGKYTLYFGTRPERIEGEAIAVPSRLSVVIARVEVRNASDAADVAAAEAVYDGMRIHGSKPATHPSLDLLSGFSPAVVAEAHRRMDEVFATVPFARTVVGPGQTPGTEVSHLYHATGTKGGWGGADPAHSMAEAILLDAHGNEMKGSLGTYAVTSPEPSVDAFWSVTVYDTERGGFLHPNEHGRHHVNSTVARRNEDGTVTFVFSRSCAAGDANCLEVPVGRFDVVARYYRPRREIVSGAWAFPRPERVE